MTSSHTHTHWHIIFWVVFLSWIVFPPWPKIIGEKRTCTGLVGGGKNIFPFLTSFQKRLGVPIVVSNPNQKREKEPYYILLLLRILHRPLDGSPVGKCLSTIFLLYYFALFCVSVSTSRGENASRNGTKESSSLSLARTGENLESFSNNSRVEKTLSSRHFGK